MSVRKSLTEIYIEACRMNHHAIMAGYTPISWREFNDSIRLPLMLLCQDEDRRQLEDIRENGT